MTVAGAAEMRACSRAAGERTSAKWIGCGVRVASRMREIGCVSVDGRARARGV